jgi:hypothetical protein
LWLTLDAGQFQTLEYNASSHAVRVTLAPADANTPAARLRIEQPAKGLGVGSYAPTGSFSTERDAFVVPLTATPTTVDLAAK